LPAQTFPVPIALGEDREDTLRTALLVIVLGGESLWFTARIEAKLCPQPGELLALIIVARGKSDENPTLSFEVCQADDDRADVLEPDPRLVSGLDESVPTLSSLSSSRMRTMPSG
jgi:hypothetical protein